MGLLVDQAWLVASLLLWLRLGALLFMTPLFAGFKGPVSVMVVLSLALAFLLAANLDAGAQGRLPSSGGSLVLAGFLEIGLGTLMAFGVHAAFAAFGMAGQWLDLQIGFGTGNVFDPVTRANSPVLGAALSSLAAVAFFALDGHHAFMRGIAFSVQQIPPGSMSLHLPVAALVRQFGGIFTLAVTLAAPVLFVLLLLEAGMAVISRMLPQMNVLFVGMPVKILLGLSVFGAAASLLPPVMARAFAGIFTFWEQVLS
jgi:flagellar biosynthetic protein FliR